MSLFSCCRVDLQQQSASFKERTNALGGNNNNRRSLRSFMRNLSTKTVSSKQKIAEEIQKVGKAKYSARIFTFPELVIATDNFNPDCLIGEGGFGRVYKGYIESIDQVVAVKQLDRNGTQGSREFFSEVLMLSLVQHPNLVNLIGYCADGDQSLLVYEYMANGSLEDHLLDLTPDREPLDWNTRMKIAAEPLFKDRQKFTFMADPVLEGQYPVKGLYQALAVAAMCLQEEADTRPLIGDVVTALEFLARPKNNEKMASELQRNNSHANSVKEGSSKRGSNFVV
ncbi:hypothetical protein COLO4_31745 [Corchorus olitorius]|uniref:Protein kinase domain-containing protein n=1 Tax=Corchorus olitorius TaxID=93759 RepID=A0A1R3H3N7_9ROSI|nr:hypothetical protein COLO4_31745 [Corchorus olitorius]